MVNEKIQQGVRMMRKITSLVLILTLILGLVFGGSFLQRGNHTYAMGAADFTDVKSDYWGYNYIDFSANSGIINGYLSPNGTYQFLPENPVSKEEAITMLYRALAASGKLESQEDFSSEFEEVLLENKIADWAKKYVSYGLKYELITTDEIVEFTNENGVGIAAPREQVAYWTAKAIDKDMTPAYSLIYVDKDNISPDMVPYIDLLYRQGIMQGDDTKMFHPASGIKRVEFAAICNRVFELISTTTYNVDKETQSYRGTIVSVDTINNKIMMTLSNGTGKLIQTNPKSKIVIDGKVRYNGLKEIKTGSVAIVAWGAFCNQEEFGKTGNTMQIHVITKTQSRVGLLTEVVKLDDDTSILKIENSDRDIVLYILDKNSQTAITPQKGKQVTFIADGIKILEIK